MSPDENVKTSRPPQPGAGGELPFRQIDRYQIEAFLGAGAMGQVYRAVHTVTKRVCALKLLPDELTKQPSFVTRFHHEAQILARMNHPNIVQIYSGGEAEGKLFLEMEYIDGGDLQKRIHAQNAAAATPTGLPEDEVRRILDGVLNALDYAHKAQVVHRDLKPANILLQKDGAVKVSDFGLAAAAGVDFQRSVVRESLTLTKVTSMETVVADPNASSGGGSSGSSSFAGTILYMSPEALRGEAPDPRDDLFSVGVIAYYLLTGKTPSVNYKPVSRARPGASKAWDPFITHCLEEERVARYQTAAVARHALPKPGKGALVPVLVGGIALVLVLGVAAVGGAAYYFWPKIKSLTGGDTPASEAKVDAPPAAGDSTRGERPEPSSTDRASRASDSGEPASAAPSDSSAPSSSSSSTSPASRSTPSSAADSSRAETEPAASTSSSTRSAEPFAGHDLVPLPSRPAEPASAENATGHELSPLPTLREQSITFPRPADLVLGEGAYELRATTSSGLPVQFAIVSGAARLDGNRLVPTDAGGITIRASQAGNSEFAPADSVVRTFRVARPRTTAAAGSDGASAASTTASTPAPAAAPTLSPAERSQLGERVGAIAIPAGLSQARIRESITFAFNGRGWTITEKNHLKIVGYLKHRANEATVTFLYSGAEIELYCLGYEINRTTGERKSPETPTGWINYLKKDLTRLLNEAAASSR